MTYVHAHRESLQGSEYLKEVYLPPSELCMPIYIGLMWSDDSVCIFVTTYFSFIAKKKNQSMIHLLYMQFLRVFLKQYKAYSMTLVIQYTNIIYGTSSRIHVTFDKFWYGVG